MIHSQFAHLNFFILILQLCNAAVLGTQNTSGYRCITERMHKMVQVHLLSTPFKYISPTNFYWKVLLFEQILILHLQLNM